MLPQSRAALALLVAKRLLVGIESLLERLCSQAGVIPLVFSSKNGGLVDDGVNLARTIQWASVFVPAVARLFDGRVFLDSSRTPHNHAVVLSNDNSLIRHATVAYLRIRSVLLNILYSFELLGKCFLIRVRNLRPTFVAIILAKRRVEDVIFRGRFCRFPLTALFRSSR